MVLCWTRWERGGVERVVWKAGMGGGKRGRRVRREEGKKSERGLRMVEGGPKDGDPLAGNGE